LAINAITGVVEGPRSSADDASSPYSATITAADEAWSWLALGF
jgi:hypothetical protein